MNKSEIRISKSETIINVLNCKIQNKFRSFKFLILNLFRASNFVLRISPQKGFSSLATVAVLGLALALFLGLVGTGALKIPGSHGLPISPLQVSEPVEDDTACNDPYNADCEKNLDNDPEDLTPAQIQHELEKD